MKKWLIGLVLFLSFTMYAQEVWIGIGRVLTTSNGNALTYETGFETNYNFGGRWLTNDGKFGLSITLTKDTAKIGQWLDKHNFIKTTTLKYEYTKVSPRFEYHFKHFYALIGTPFFFSPEKNVDTKIGIETGLGTQYYFSKHWGVQAETKFCHLKDFLVPVANTLFCDFALIYKW